MWYVCRRLLVIVWLLVFLVCCVSFVVWLLLFVDCRMLCADRFNCLRSLFVGCCVSLLVRCLTFVGLLFACCCSLIVVCHLLRIVARLLFVVAH